MTGSDEPGDGADEEVDLDAPRPPTTALDPAQEPIDWEAQGEGGAELDGELHEVREPSTTMDTVQETPLSVRERRGGETSGEDGGESGAGDGA